MSELSSQAYGEPGGALAGSEEDRAQRVFRFPPWARAQVISAETGACQSEGEIGLIRVLDLANTFSILAVQTEDIGIRSEDGFELLGRAAESEVRGCSLMPAA